MQYELTTFWWKLPSTKQHKAKHVAGCNMDLKFLVPSIVLVVWYVLNFFLL